MSFIDWMFNRGRQYQPHIVTQLDLSAVFAIPDTEAWWLAVHQLINEAEKETIEGARNRTGDPYKCIAAVGAGEGISLVRQKLIDARTLALRDMQPQQKAG